MGYDLQSSIHKLGYCIQGNNVNWCLLKLIFPQVLINMLVVLVSNWVSDPIF